MRCECMRSVKAPQAPLRGPVRDRVALRPALAQDDKPIKWHATLINTRFRQEDGAGEGAGAAGGSGGRGAGGRGGRGGRGGGGAPLGRGGAGADRATVDARRILRVRAPSRTSIFFSRLPGRVARAQTAHQSREAALTLHHRPWRLLSTFKSAPRPLFIRCPPQFFGSRRFGDVTVNAMELSERGKFDADKYYHCVCMAPFEG